MYIKNHKLIKSSGFDVSIDKTPNISGNFIAGDLDTIIIHYTAGSSLASTVDWLKNPRAGASAHIVVGKNGEIVQLAPFNLITWHAGISEWKGKRSLNKYSIGIEIDNVGYLHKRVDGYYTSFGKKIDDDQVILVKHKNDDTKIAWEAFTEKQIRVVEELCLIIKDHYNIKEIVGHDDISPGRKFDPGPAFPLHSLREKILFGRKEDDRPEFKFEKNSKAVILAELLNIRSEPSLNSVRVSEPLPKGTKLDILKQEGNWAYVKADIEGWVNTSWIEKFDL